MEINFTLVVQAANFCVAYLLMRWLFFKPVIEVIQQDSAKRAQLVDSIAEHQAKVAEHEQQNHADWQACREYFSCHTPDVTRQSLYIFRDLAPTFHIESLSQEKMGALSQDMTQNLLAKVRAHGR